MSAITQWAQDIVLPVVFNIVRWIAGMQVDATDINGRLHLTCPQMAGLLGITDKVARHHLNKVYEELSTNNGGGMGCPHHYLRVYSVPVTYVRDTSNPNAGGGGTKQTKFYDLEILLLIAERMEDSPRKQAILAEGRAIVAAYHTHGFVVNQQVARTDPAR